MRKMILILSFTILFLIFILIFSLGKTGFSVKAEKIREPVFAGSWYPKEKLELKKLVDSYLRNSENLELGNVRAIIVPHAGYEFSGQIAADSFRQLNEKYENVFLMGPSHKYPLKNISISSANFYKTPLGKIPLSNKINKLSKEKIYSEIPEADANEHSLEIELPFLQRQLKNFKLIPIIVGEVNPEELKSVLLNYVGNKDLIVVSVDLSHYHEYSQALSLDSESINNILGLNDEKILNSEIDAPWAVSSLLKLAKEKNWEPYLITYANSGDVTGDMPSVVGYSAMIFVEENPLTKEQKFLLNLSRKTLETYYNEGKVLEIFEKDIPAKLKQKKGCFVTLNKNGDLRGCIGTLTPEIPLYKCVIENSLNAALHDPRFFPVSKDELNNLNVEISVLTKPKILKYNSFNELLQKLRMYKHGVILQNGHYSSTYLPSVWKMIPNKIQFLESLCLKGGMSKSCWQSSSTIVQTYESESFKE